MPRVFQIIILSYIAVSLTGCNSHQKDRPVWEQVKAKDLLAPPEIEKSTNKLPEIINLSVYIFEIPAENTSVLDDIWKTGILYTKPFKFNDYEAFSANSFSVGFGQVQSWDKIGDLLRTAGGRKNKSISLLLPDGQPEDLTITKLSNEQTVFYTSTNGSMEGAIIGPGLLILRVKAEKIPESRGVCQISALPIMPSSIKSPIPQLAAREKFSEFHFTSAGFGLKMAPGDFFLLCPKEYLDNQVTLGSIFFSRPGNKASIRVFLFVCSGINN